MISVSDQYMTALTGNVRTVTYIVQMAREDNWNNWIDISDRVLDIETDAALANSNTTLTMDIDNSDYSFSPSNTTSTINIDSTGTYNPLLYPGHLVRIVAGFEEAAGDGTNITCTQSQQLTLFQGKLVNSNQLIADSSGNITLMHNYTSSPSYINQSTSPSLTAKALDGAIGVGTEYTYPCYTIWEEIVQTFTVAGSCPQLLESISVYCIPGKTASSYGVGAVQIQIGALPADISVTYSGTNPPINITNNSISVAPTNGWMTFNFSDQIYLQPGEQYGFYINDTHIANSYPNQPVGSNDTYATGSAYPGNSYWYQHYCNFQPTTGYYQQYTGTSIGFQLNTRSAYYYTNGTATVVFDCTDNIMGYTSIEFSGNAPNGTTITYQYASSIDNVNWSSWQTNLNNVPPDRYFATLINMTTTSIDISPYISSITFNYEISASETSPGMIPIFYGLTGDDTDSQTYPGKIQLTVRDLSKNFSDLYIPIQQPTQSYVNSLAEQVISSILTQYTPATKLGSFLTNINAYFIATQTNYLISNAVFRSTDVWSALQSISDLMGWYLLFNQAGILTLQPRKWQNFADIIFDEDMLITNELKFSDADIRNVIYLKADTYNAGTLTGCAIDMESIAQFGQRYFEIYQSITAMVTSQDQLNALGEAIKQDYAWFTATCTATIPFFPIIELGDIVGIRDNRQGINETTNLFRVVEVVHNLAQDNKRTTLTLQVYRSFQFECSYYPLAPTNVSGSIIDKTLQWYSGCSWSGKAQRTFYYPEISWVAPTANSDGTPVTFLSGYKVYRSDSSASNWISGNFSSTVVNANNEIALDVIAGTFLDQSNTTNPCYTIKPNYQYIGQTFSPAGNNISEIDVYFENVPTNTTLTLYAYSGVYSTYVSCYTGCTNTWVPFKLPAPIAASTYSNFKIYANNINTTLWASPSQYGGGNLTSANINYPSQDLLFRTYSSTPKAFGTWTSQVFDFTAIPSGITLTSNITLNNSNEAVNVYFNGSNDNVTWTGWQLINNNTPPNYRYEQFQYQLSTTDNTSPLVIGATINYTLTGTALYLGDSIAYVSNNYQIGLGVDTNFNYIGFVPMCISGISQNINWYIDYMCGPGNHEYQVLAVNDQGLTAPTGSSQIFTINVPNPQ